MYCIYVCMYVCMYVYVCMYPEEVLVVVVSEVECIIAVILLMVRPGYHTDSAYMRKRTCAHTYIHTYSYIHTFNIRVCMYVYTYVCMYVCMYVCRKIY